MAVVAPPPLQSKLDHWGPGTTVAHPVASSGQMTDIMSYQYPPPPPNGADIALPPPGYMPADYSSIPHSSGLGQDPHMSPKERRDSMSKSMNMKLKRSLSTPVVRPQQANMQPQVVPQPDHSALGLAAEKRRNKLGYHRTSVACGHCRRRKIRCIPSPADVQGRCVNCIRLKKECSFYPVDQQPPPDTRKNSASRSSVGLPPPPSLPPPKMAALITSRLNSLPVPDIRGRPQQDSQQLTMPSIQTMAPPSMKPSGAEPFSPDPKMSSGATSGRPFEYGHGGMTNWMSADTSPSSSKPGDLNATWRSYPQESPITPAFSPYTPHAQPPSATWTPQSESASREDMGWSYPPPPPRSLSFGSETMSNHHTQYPSISQMTSGHSSRPYDRKSGTMSEMYQSPITTTIPGVDSIPGTTLDHHVSLSAGAAGPPAYASWQQPYSYSKPSDATDAYVGWTNEHSGTPSSESHTTSSMYYTGR